MKDMIDFDLILQTERVVLRPLIPEDYESFNKLTEDKSMWIYFTSDLSEKAELKDCIIETLDFERVELKTDILNMPARRALLRIGAKEEGVLRSHMLMTHNRRRDTIYYSILKSEWNEIKLKNSWQ
jgi:RimJ/RimL family protein N-acetyltransferase